MGPTGNHMNQHHQPELPVYKTVKHSLQAVLKDPERHGNALSDAVLTGHTLVQHTSHFIKLYAIHCKDTDEPLPEMDRHFVMCVMKTIGVRPTTGIGRPPGDKTVAMMTTLKTFHDAHYAPLMTNETICLPTGLDNMLSYLADGLVTVFETNIKQHFVEYVERFVNVVMNKKATMDELTTKEAKRAFVSQLRRYKVLLLGNEREGLPAELLEHASSIVPQRAYQKDNLMYDIKCSPQDYLPCMFYMMRYVEGRDQTIYNLFPLRTEIVPKYVPLDTQTLVLFVLKDGLNGHTKSSLMSKGNMKANEDAIWAACFNTDMRCFRKKNYKFDHRILTDGEAVSILLIRRDKKKGGKKTVRESKEPYLHDLGVKEQKAYQTKNKVAIDPNMDDIIFCSGKNQEGDMQHFRYTRNQRKKETKTKKYRAIQEGLKKEEIIEGKSVEEWQTELSKHNKKTLDFDKFSAYIKAKNEVTQKISDFYRQRIFRQLKWYGFINRQKTERSMIRRFGSIYGPPSETDIYIGDWEQFKHRKFKEPSIGKGIRNVFRKAGYRVTLVDEFRTSCMCYNCQSEEGRCETFRVCQNPKPWKATETTTRHGLLMCQTCSGLWNRDVNSSLNILRIVEDTLAGKGRPKYLSRSKKKQDGGVTSTSGDDNPVKPRRKKPRLSTTQTTC